MELEQKQLEQKRACMVTKDIAFEVGCSLPTAYEIVNREDFPKIRYGRKIIIPREAFERWLAKAAADGLDLKDPTPRGILQTAAGR